MRTIKEILLFMLITALGTAHAQTPPNQAARPVMRATVFQNVNVIPMDRERVLENQTVVVRDGRITEMGDAKRIKMPADAVRIDGRGKFLMPGIAEMHGHLPHPNQGEQFARNVLLLFVANGVTTVRGMFGFPNHVALRDQVARGELLGPTVFAASPALGGQNVKSPEEARRLVKEYKAAGFNLLKVHEGLSVQVYDAIVAAAREEKISLGGHISNDVGLERALKARQSTIEHLDGYLEALEADNSPIRNADPQTRAQQLPNYLDERKIPALVAATRDAGVWNVPTMALWQTFFSKDSVETLRLRPELRYMPPQMIEQWSQQRTSQLQQNASPEMLKRVLDLRNQVLKALAQGEGKILLGSDAPQLFSVPGFSLQREMQAMINAGLTPYQVLESGTRNVALYLDGASEFGTVAVGRRADLILLDGNPLKDITNMEKKAGVMVRGRWIPADELKRILDEVANSVKPQ
jgi:imidazolonepropionase-like amidohydrolase